MLGKKKTKRKTQRDTTRGLGKLQREDRNKVRALCYCGDYELHFFEITQGLFDSIMN